MIDPAIDQFFSERKESWLKKKLKANASEAEKTAVEAECEDVFLLKNWLPNAAKRAGQISLSTHPCTFSHPSARKNKNGYASSIIAKNVRSEDGFLRAGNTVVEPDALGNAAALDVYRFLTLIMQDGRSLLEHIESETELAIELLGQSDKDNKELISGFLAMIEEGKEVVTSSKIKQVYFPVDDAYHQLSILTNSANLYALRNRIDSIRFSEQAKELRELKKAGKHSEHVFGEIYDITTIGYGGTKPQNISVLNNQNAGKAHLLLSAPPLLEERDIRLPKKDFFLETFNPWYLKETFHAFHRIIKTEYNNVRIREGRDFRIQEYVDHVIHKMWQLRTKLEAEQRELPAQLKSHQKTWLYPQFKQDREENSEWLEAVCSDLIRSFSLQGYNKVLGRQAIQLGDDVYSAVERIVLENREALR